MKRKIAASLCAVLCAVLFAAFCAPAFAADTDYTGPLNAETGAPLYGSEPGSQSTDGRAQITNAMYYDWYLLDFIYPIGDTLSEVRADAADGMVLTSPVNLSVTGEASLLVYQDGNEYTGDTSHISEAGSYLVFSATGGQSRRILSFTLVGSSTNALHTFVVPDGFYIREVTRDEKPVYADRYSVSMETEGAYFIEYECNATDMVYTLEVQIDRTPTYLEFDGRIDAQGRVRSALKFTGAQPGDSLYLTRFGESVPLTVNGDGTGEITDPGNYKLIVKDPAGNSVEYNFVILQYFNMQSWVFFLMVAAALIAVLVYVWMQRKRLKIA